MSLPDANSTGSSASLIILMVFAAPLLAAMWVIPAGTVAATMLAPLSLRIAPMRTPSALIVLAALGAAAGFGLLFMFGLAITTYLHVDYPQPPLLVALKLSWIYGPVFGALTAAGWWWLLPRPSPKAEAIGA